MARWEDLAAWQGPTSNQGGPMAEVRGLVLHIAEGFFQGTIDWCKNPASQTSVHFVGGKTGERAQLVDTDSTAWTQANGNGRWLSLENIGFAPDALTSQQIEFAAQLFARGHQVYGYPLQLTDSPNGVGLGHHSMGGNSWGGHPDCPGPAIIAQKPLILSRAIEIVNGTPSEDDLKLVREPNGSVYLLTGQTDNRGRLVLIPISDDKRFNAYQAAGVAVQQMAGALDWAHFTVGPLPSSGGVAHGSVSGTFTGTVA